MEKEKEVKFSDYLNILYKWKKFLLINMFIIITAVTVYSFLIPEQFKATSIVLLSSQNEMGLGGLAGLISGGGSSLFGSQLLGINGTSQDIILGILNSRTALTKAINKFDLIDYYGVSDQNMDLALKEFMDDIIFEPTEYGMIEVSIVNEDPQLSAIMANYFVTIADSINIELNMEKARNNRTFIEKRYLKNINDLKVAEDSFYYFQKKYKIFAIPEQLEVSVKAAAEIEALYTQKELTAELIKKNYGKNSPLYESTMSELNVLKHKIEELNKSQKLSFTSNVLFPFAKIPEMSIKYFRTYREIELQTKIMEFVLPLYEQALVEEQKNIPTLYVVDRAVPPQWKDSPKRAFIILGFSTLFGFLFLMFVFRGEAAVNRTYFSNKIEEYETVFYRKILHLYKINL